MLSKNMDFHRFVSKQERNRKGSLPLKKRRFQPIKEDLQSMVPADSLISLAHTPLAVPRPHAAFVPLTEASFSVPGFGSPSDDKIAALALVAAAAGLNATAAVPPSPAVLVSPKPDSSFAMAPSVPPVIPKESYSTSEVPQTLASSPSLQEDDDDTFGHENDEEEDSSSRQAPGKRVRHRPLLLPLPGGCHGKSSRHNSYCRRLPCYNGSNYCKLHYRQYVLGGDKKREGKRAAAKGQLRVTAPPETKLTPAKKPAKRALLSPKPKSATAGSASSSAESPTNQHQDRRYMGSPNETRCLATTTRGRACAYVSVHGTKYCYLHADYDTNPPPRRGGCAPVGGEAKNSSGSGAESPATSESSAFRRVSEGTHLAGVVEAIPATTESRHAISDGSVSSPPSIASEDSRRFMSPSPTTADNGGGNRTPRKRTPSRRTTAKLKEKHADSPFPLLSMISTDQWSRKMVRIATGPFKGRTGEVEKWGNGWVSVQVPGVGLHNRRSFELYLHSEKGEDHESSAAAMPNETETGDVKEEEEEEEDQAKSKSMLFRCVSRDARSPMVLPGSSRSNQVAMVTPRPSKGSIAVASSDDSETGAALPRFKSIPNHDDAPETPTSNFKPRSTVQVQITPSVQQKSRSETSIPLVDSLMLSEEGSKKYKLDMLFGTAALERSRRSINKPSRYEDTEMLARTKRDRKMLEEGSCSPSDSNDSKRQRIQGGD